MNSGDAMNSVNGRAPRKRKKKLYVLFTKDTDVLLPQRS